MCSFYVFQFREIECLWIECLLHRVFLEKHFTFLLSFLHSEAAAESWGERESDPFSSMLMVTSADTWIVTQTFHVPTVHPSAMCPLCTPLPCAHCVPSPTYRVPTVHSPLSWACCASSIAVCQLCSLPCRVPTVHPPVPCAHCAPSLLDISLIYKLA